MELKLLAVGDVVAPSGCDYLCRRLPGLIKKHQIDFTVVNGENASVLGITPRQAEDIFDAGANVITMGNHTWGKRELIPYARECPNLLRPANYAPQAPGRGWGVYETEFGDITVIDLIGRCGMDYTPENPFLQV